VLVFEPSEVLTGSVTTELAVITVPKPAEENELLKEPELIAWTSFASKSVNAALVVVASFDVLDVIARGSGSISDMI
jgi:hypothetical protein